MTTVKKNVVDKLQGKKPTVTGDCTACAGKGIDLSVSAHELCAVCGGSGKVAVTAQ